MGFGVWGFGLGVWVWGEEFGIRGLGFGVWGLVFGVFGFRALGFKSMDLGSQVRGEGPLSSEDGTHTPIDARFWPWLAAFSV